MTKQEIAAQRKLAARLQAEKNAEKSKNVIQAGANLPSQWGKVVTNEQRLIDNGHFMKTSERAKLDFMRESYRKRKKELKGSTIIRVTK
jgi:predicted DNA-binding WGR domain protein